MSIAQKLENGYKNQIENIKNEINRISKMRQIGALVLDIGGHCISTIASKINCSRKFIKKCYMIVINSLEIKSNRCNCGRKRITSTYPELEADIRKIIEEKLYVDPHFQTEQLFCSLTIDQVMMKLLETRKYKEKFISRSSLGNLLNKMKYNLKKVKRNKPLREIDETDDIFENFNIKKKH